MALYAEPFSQILRQIGDVEWVAVPGDPHRSQTLRSAIAGCVSGFRTGRRKPTLVHLELSGRALFEFWFGLGLRLSGRSVPYALTLHDPPSVVGASMLFGVLDRRGLRRIGMWLSRVVGARLERGLLGGAIRVFALTRAGAEAVSAERGIAAVALAHPVEFSSPSPDRTVFLPGYLSDQVAAAEVVEALPRSGGWRVVVGASSENVRDAVQRAAEGTDLTIELLGFVDEATLLAVYRRSAVVVRLVTGPYANPLATSSPLCWALGAGAAVITNDPRAGASELAAEGVVMQTDAVGDAVTTLVTDRAACDQLRQRAAAYAHARMSVDEVKAAYVAALPAGLLG
ncbi:hypothetical protein Back2_13770 [Nocardioides baekrokdamisoli]|uniref:Glycosyl transferase family 1 domain-containing protein n=1 Tax=Nocardioides baekrokdamisoli TaxID=1804624 RepID=A0A3G9IDN6_9ACTN|nr:hypothetical protein Back2_13770 [Nocardioides baekrokdamisoli]